MQDMRRLRVLGQVSVTERLRVLRFERDRSFRAGQYLGLSLASPAGEESLPPRLYSIASGEEEGVWEVLYTVEEEGLLSPRLAALGEGEELLVQGPAGDFASDFGPGGRGPAAWVAGGTGIAPFLSLARSGRAEGSFLIQAASRPELFYGAELFESLLGPSYRRCCLRAPEDDARFLRCRSPAFIAEAADLPLDLPWLLCGGSEFVVDTREALLARGVPYARILAEVYF